MGNIIKLPMKSDEKLAQIQSVKRSLEEIYDISDTYEKYAMREDANPYIILYQQMLLSYQAAYILELVYKIDAESDQNNIELMKKLKETTN